MPDAYENFMEPCSRMLTVADRCWSFPWFIQDDLRVLIHFYAYEHFMDPALDNYIKRIVRDYIHYRDEVRGDRSR